eukprot:gene8159-16775_t
MINKKSCRGNVKGKEDLDILQNMWNEADESYIDLPASCMEYLDELSDENIKGFQSFMKDLFEWAPNLQDQDSIKKKRNGKDQFLNKDLKPNKIVNISSSISITNMVHPSSFAPPQMLIINSDSNTNEIMATIAKRGGIDEYSNETFQNLKNTSKMNKLQSSRGGKKKKSDSSKSNQITRTLSTTSSNNGVIGGISIKTEDFSQNSQTIDPSNNTNQLNAIECNPDTENLSIEDIQNFTLQNWIYLKDSFYSNIQHKNISKVISSKIKTNINTNFILGKRGRPYTDIWEEEDFLEKVSSTSNITSNSKSSSSCTRGVLEDWSKLFRHYNDDHDGFYIELLLDCMTSQIAKKRKWRQSNDDNNITTKDNGPISIIAPPPPVALQHPASWGLNARNMRKNKNIPIDVHKLHPACVSNTIVLSPATISAEYTQKNNMNSHNINNGVTAGEDWDELNIAIRNDILELQLQQAQNFILIKRLTARLERESTVGLKTLQEKKKELYKSLCSVSDMLAYTSNSNIKENMYKNWSNYESLTENMGRDEKNEEEEEEGVTSSSSVTDMISSNSSRIIHDEIISNSISNQNYNTENTANNTVGIDIDRDLIVEKEGSRGWLGACKCKDVPYGRFMEDKMVTPLQANIHVQSKVDSVLRFIKVRHIDSAIGHWLAVEDGRIAPPGTHIPSPAHPFTSRVINHHE